jgi:hypothetical protein
MASGDKNASADPDQRPCSSHGPHRIGSVHRRQLRANGFGSDGAVTRMTRRVVRVAATIDRFPVLLGGVAASCLETAPVKPNDRGALGCTASAVRYVACRGDASWLGHRSTRTSKHNGGGNRIRSRLRERARGGSLTSGCRAVPQSTFGRSRCAAAAGCVQSVYGEVGRRRRA